LELVAPGTFPFASRQQAGRDVFEDQRFSIARGFGPVRAITVLPGIPNSARLDDIGEPPLDDGAILARTLALGVCGTDREIVAGEYGEAPPASKRLVLGHESFGEVMSAPPSSGFAQGDLVVGIVRRPDPVPCAACAAGEWDMCRNGQYTERGIKARHGFGAERFRIEPEFAIKIDAALGPLGVLMEPTSIVAKAWDHIERIGRRFNSWQPRRLLVTGSGPIGLLAALLGVQRGYDTHVLDRGRDQAKAALIHKLGATHHAGGLDQLGEMAADVIMECTGGPNVIAGVLGRSAPSGIACLLGLGGDHAATFDIGRFNRAMVLDNDVVFGAVNANRLHYEMAARALARADCVWLGGLISRRVPLARWYEALEYHPGDIKVVVDFDS
jgi:threonine dehydrogenase-like Zn-dependent dehydrogenase